MDGKGNTTYRSYLVATPEAAQKLGISNPPEGEAGIRALAEKLNNHKKQFTFTFTDTASTSGYAVPTFVVDAPGGGGKIPVMPQYLISQSDGRVMLRNFEGKITIYHEGTPEDHIDDETCTVCRTDHSTINIGPAAELWAVKRRAGEMELPENVTRLAKAAKQPPLISVDQLEAIERKLEVGDD